MLCTLSLSLSLSLSLDEVVEERERERNVNLLIVYFTNFQVADRILSAKLRFCIRCKEEEEEV